MDWVEEALCTDMDTELFFGDTEDSYLKSDATAEMIDILCNECPVNIECYNFGVATRSTGIWGGKWLQMGRPEKNLEKLLEEY